jgi:hypothetical protein
MVVESITQAHATSARWENSRIRKVELIASCVPKGISRTPQAQTRAPHAVMGLIKMTKVLTDVRRAVASTVLQAHTTLHAKVPSLVLARSALQGNTRPMTGLKGAPRALLDSMANQLVQLRASRAQQTTTRTKPAKHNARNATWSVVLGRVIPRASTNTLAHAWIADLVSSKRAQTRRTVPTVMRDLMQVPQAHTRAWHVTAPPLGKTQMGKAVAKPLRCVARGSMNCPHHQQQKIAYVRL